MGGPGSARGIGSGMNPRAAGLFLAVVTLPIGARADAVAIPDLDCPEGSEVQARHAGGWCALRSCSAAAPCSAGDSCEARRVCSRSLTYSEGSRTWPPPAGFDPARHASVVTASCAVGGSCTGDDAGTFASRDLDPGPATCATTDVCVPAPPAPPPVSPPAAAPLGPAASSCSAGRGGSSLAPIVGFLLVACARRRR